MRRGRYGSAKRDHLIRFALPVTQENAFGEPVEESLADAGSAWAAISYGTGRERREAAIERSDLTATFITLQSAATRAIGTEHVILFDGHRWDITSAAPFDRHEIEFTTTRVAG
jgi:head-tail adaptor